MPGTPRRFSIAAVFTGSSSLFQMTLGPHQRWKSKAVVLRTRGNFGKASHSWSRRLAQGRHVTVTWPIQRACIFTLRGQAGRCAPGTARSPSCPAHKQSVPKGWRTVNQRRKSQRPCAPINSIPLLCFNCLFRPVQDRLLSLATEKKILPITFFFLFPVKILLRERRPENSLCSQPNRDIYDSAGVKTTGKVAHIFFKRKTARIPFH